MTEGISIITDDKGNNKALIIDLLYLKKANIKAEEVLKGLSNLQELIDNTPEKSQQNTWDAAKEKLNKIKPEN
ncbi:hypothetical protein PBAC_19800 [Pedobacter glucosidilyticus]|uniref:Uncharacterized protein n=1 Tax=Pedobacter aquae TaxID=2605747 RepID=A0A5C0VLW4_9SPHI|nr:MULTISPECIES: hypothetical protein [Pedobacter]KHJ37819.1 hypothetical protein PBAC_19800 [Pedobacter glucosidilyticus]QEK51974.1 hypothetical protein FYC62_10160 [Pedobacter aquae]